MALASAILQVLKGDRKVVDPDWLDQFTIKSATQKYLDILIKPDEIGDRIYKIAGGPVSESGSCQEVVLKK